MSDENKPAGPRRIDFHFSPQEAGVACLHRTTPGGSIEELVLVWCVGRKAVITGRHTGPDDELPPLDDLMQRFLESPPAVLVHREHTGGFFFNQGDGFHSRPPNDTDEGHNGLLELAMQIARTHWPEWEEMLSRAGVPALPVSPSFVRTELSSTPEG